MTNFNERTNTLLYKNIISHNLFSKGWCFCCVWEMSWRRNRLLYWPSSTSFSSWLGCPTVGHWRPQALSLQADSHAGSQFGILSPTDSDRLCAWVYYFLPPTCFRCSSAYLHRCISWLTARSMVNMLQHLNINTVLFQTIQFNTSTQFNHKVKCKNS